MDSHKNTSQTLQEISDVSRSYSIRKQRSSHRYRITIPKSALEELNVENGDDLGFWVRATKQSELQLIYETDASNCDILTSVSKHSSGELTVPSAIGAASRLEEENIQWTTFQKPNNEYLIAGTTTKELSSHTTDGSSELTSRSLKHVPQKINHNGSNWNQEHFQLYFPVEDAETIGWNDGETVGLLLISIDGKIGLKFTRKESQVPVKSRKKVQKTGDAQRDRLIYPPNSLVRSLRLVDTPIQLYATKAGSVLTKTKESDSD